MLGVRSKFHSNVYEYRATCFWRMYAHIDLLQSFTIWIYKQSWTAPICIPSIHCFRWSICNVGTSKHSIIRVDIKVAAYFLIKYKQHGIVSLFERTTVFTSDICLYAGSNHVHSMYLWSNDSTYTPTTCADYLSVFVLCLSLPSCQWYWLVWFDMCLYMYLVIRWHNCDKYAAMKAVNLCLTEWCEFVREMKSYIEAQTFADVVG